MENDARSWNKPGGLAKVTRVNNYINAWNPDERCENTLGSLRNGDLLILLECTWSARMILSAYYVRAISKHGMCLVGRDYIDEAG